MLLFNLLLPPEHRVKKHNILVSILLPEPREPENINTFLQSLMDEFADLEMGVPAIDATIGEGFMLLILRSTSLQL